MSNEDADLRRYLAGPTSRRQLLKGFGLAGVGLAVGGSVLAACGSDDNGSSGSTDTTAASGGGDTTGGAASDAGAQLAEILGVDSANAGGGQAWKMGAVLALTGPGSYYGKTMTNGIDLAVKHIKAAAVPTSR
ncbi:MAG: hypothetical protein R2715_19070 [Ilumatobacteraceae bacterium]